MSKERHDALLMEILQEKKTIAGFLQSVFGFLSSRTDFYFEMKNKDDTLGYPTGFKEQLVLQIIKQFEVKESESVEIKIEFIDNDFIEAGENIKIDCENEIEDFYEIKNYNSSDNNFNNFKKTHDNSVLNEIFDKNNKKQLVFFNLNKESANLNNNKVDMNLVPEKNVLKSNKKIEIVKQKLKNETDFEPDFSVPPRNENDFVKIPEGYKCQICMKITKNKPAIIAHVESHLEQSRLCFKCGKYFEDRFKAKSHFSTCKENLKTFDKIKTIKNELNKNNEIQNSCDGNVTNQLICNKIFLGYDEKIKQTKTCTICSKKFSKFILAYDHMNSHSQQKPYICSCGVKMAFYTNFFHHIKKFKCSLIGITLPSYCNYGIKRKRIEIKQPQALKMKDMKESPCFCKICNKNFLKSDIIQHFSTEEHLIKETEWIKKYDVKKFICHACQINFDDMLKRCVHEIEEHKTKINSRFFNKFERPSKHCDICNKTFAKLIHYFDHMNMHNKIQPYKCSCGTKIQHYQSFICHFQKMGCSIEGRIFPDYCPKTFQTSRVTTVAKL